MKKLIAFSALLITLFLFTSFIILGSFMDNKRENFLDGEFDRMYKDINDIQLISLVSDTFDDEMVCLAVENKLRNMNKYIWKLGQKIDQYRVASEEFMKDNYYLEQKIRFNEYEVNYFLLMKNMVKRCNMSKKIILFFYQNSADCKKCDDQSFILTDIKEMDEKNKQNEIAIFSYDMDLNISSLDILTKYYEVGSYPCLVIDGNSYCGIQDKDTIMSLICENADNFTICNES